MGSSSKLRGLPETVVQGERWGDGCVAGSKIIRPPDRAYTEFSPNFASVFDPNTQKNNPHLLMQAFEACMPLIVVHPPSCKATVLRLCTPHFHWNIRKFQFLS